MADGDQQPPLSPDEEDRTASSVPRGTAIVPKSIGPYKILRRLGSGGMGVVYLAEQHEPVRRKVALKVIKQGIGSQHAVGRFEAEQQALALMNHPNVAKVFDAGCTEQGRPYFVMEFVAGLPINKYCDRYHLRISERLSLFRQVTLAVHHAHQKGVIHRDLKPSNILVAVQDGEPVPKIIDFGIAKAVSQPLTERALLTEQGSVIGTPEYMSPEQADAGALGVDVTSDIYSLGVVLYELLVGFLPFDSEALRRAGWSEMGRILRDDTPPKPSDRLSESGARTQEVADLRQCELAVLRRRLAGDLDWIVSKAMDKDRLRRYQSASELEADLARFMRHEPVLARPPSLTYRLGKLARRRKGLLSAVATALFLLVAGTAVSTWQAIEAVNARREADARRVQAEALISFMIGDLNDKLSSVGRLDILDDVGAAALAYFAAIPEEQLTGEELRRRSQTMTQIGSVRFKRANLVGALEAFSDAVLVAEALADRDPDNPDWQMALSTSHYWVGFVHWRRLELEAALVSFSLYRDTAERLTQAHPDNSDYRLELGYAHSNIGSVLREMGDLDGALQSFEYCLQVEQALLSADPGNTDLTFDVADSHNAVGKVLEAQGRLDDAAAHYRDDLRLKEWLVDQDPRNSTWRHYLGNSHDHLAILLEDLDQRAEAENHFRQAVGIFTELVAQDAANARWQRELAQNTLAVARHVMAADLGGALDETRLALGILVRLMEVDPSDPRARQDVANARLHLGNALLKADDQARALEQITAAIDLLTTGLPDSGADQVTTQIHGRAEILLGKAHSAAGNSDEARAAWSRAVAILQAEASAGNDKLFMAPYASALQLLGRAEEARPYLDRLEAMGYSYANSAILTEQ